MLQAVCELYRVSHEGVLMVIDLNGILRVYAGAIGIHPVGIVGLLHRSGFS